MKNKESLKILMDIQSDWENGVEYEALNVAINAIKKQISKKPIKDNTNFQKCIVCDELVNSDMHYYCPVCGNKIDWSKD